jgi:hypothetical protein
LEEAGAQRRVLVSQQPAARQRGGGKTQRKDRRSGSVGGWSEKAVRAAASEQAPQSRAACNEDLGPSCSPLPSAARPTHPTKPPTKQPPLPLANPPACDVGVCHLQEVEGGVQGQADALLGQQGPAGRMKGRKKRGAGRQVQTT